MTDEEIKKHNHRVTHLPVWLKSGHMPTVITKAFAEMLMKQGQWEKYKDVMIINQWLPAGKPGPEEQIQ